MKMYWKGKRTVITGNQGHDMSHKTTLFTPCVFKLSAIINANRTLPIEHQGDPMPGCQGLIGGSW
jgi:hypothetical protein